MTDQPERSKPVGQQPGSEMMVPAMKRLLARPARARTSARPAAAGGHVDGQDCDTCLGRGRVIKAISAGP